MYRELIETLLRHGIMEYNSKGNPVPFDFTSLGFKTEEEFIRDKIKSFDGTEKIILIKALKSSGHNFRDFI